MVGLEKESSYNAGDLLYLQAPQALMWLKGAAFQGLRLNSGPTAPE
jgi:hypothetical protein